MTSAQLDQRNRREPDRREKSALVTGSSAGIGKAAAAGLLTDGWSVAICGRDQDRLDAALDDLSAKGENRVVAIKADCSDPMQLSHLYEAAVRALGPITCLVNNVGSSFAAPFLELEDEAWMTDFELKLFSAIRLTRWTVSSMIERRSGGRIINVLSVGGKTPHAERSPTVVTRAAGLALTKVLSKEFAQHDILVNAICVGVIKSRQHEVRASNSGLEPDEYYAEIARNRKIPLGRVGETHEAADLIRFLASPEAAYITGTAINVDGGLCSAV